MPVGTGDSIASHFRPDVQGLRALAVLLVVVYHMGFGIPGGFIGVDVFFVISGFVITNSILRRWEAGKGFSPIDFFGRRVRRLLPALAVMTVVCAPMMSLLTTFDGREQGFVTARAASTFWANIQLMLFRPNGYFVSSEKMNPFLHTWSLSLEEQIYFVFPFILISLLFVASRLRVFVRQKVVVLGLVFVGAASFYLSLLGAFAIDAWPVNAYISPSDNAEYLRQLAFYSPVTRLWEFLAGAIVALLPRVGKKSFAEVVGTVGLVMIVGSAFRINAQVAFPGLVAVVPVAGACLLILSNGAWVRWLLVGRLVGWIGDRSYSWYLWHWPMIAFSTAIFPGSRVAVLSSAVVSLVVAAVSFRFVEHPIREGTYWRSPRWRSFVLGAICTVVPLVVSTAGKMEPTPELATHEDVEFGCVVAEFSVLQSNEKCFWPVEDARGDAVLIGDSQAGHLSGAFIDAAHQNSLNARILTRTGAFFQNTPDRDELARLLIEDVKPRIVVLGQLTMSWDPEYWSPQIRNYVQRLSDAGIGVVVPHRVRKGGEPLKCASIRFVMLKNVCELSDEETMQSANEVNEIIALEAEALSGVQHLVFIDPNSTLCPMEPCKSRQNGKWIWRDGGHISREGAKRLTPQLSAAIASMLSR